MLEFHLPVVASRLVVNGDAEAGRFVEHVSLVPSSSRGESSDMLPFVPAMRPVTVTWSCSRRTIARCSMLTASGCWRAANPKSLSPRKARPTRLTWKCATYRVSIA